MRLGPLRLPWHLLRLVGSALRYSAATRRVTIVIAIVVGFALVLATATAQTAAPLLLYPFA